MGSDDDLVTRQAALDALTKAVPNVRERFRNWWVEWAPERAPIGGEGGILAHYILNENAIGDAVPCLPAVFSLIERFLRFGDVEVQAMATRFLEELILEGTSPERWISLVGTLARQRAQELDSLHNQYTVGLYPELDKPPAS